MIADLKILGVLGKDSQADGGLKHGVVSVVMGTITCYERKGT